MRAGRAEPGVTKAKSPERSIARHPVRGNPAGSHKVEGVFMEGLAPHRGEFGEMPQL